MTTRLTPLDAAFYASETSSAPMHIGSLAIVENAHGALTYDKLVDIVNSRLCLVPRYRQKVREVPLGLGRPVWVDDKDFDITYHIRRSALPTPGSDEQLYELVARLSSRQLDRTLPLWEMYLVEGLEGGRCAIFTKSHSALVDGDESLEIGHVILDSNETPREIADDLWTPGHQPNDATLALQAVADIVSRPGDGIEMVRQTASDIGARVGGTVAAIGKFAAGLHSPPGVAPPSPLNAAISRNRLFDVAKTDLEDYRRIRQQFGCSINDAILAVVTGALRTWLQTRGEPIAAYSSIRAYVPMSVYVGDAGATTANIAGSELSSFLIDLPVGEPNQVIRLSHISHATEAHKRNTRSVTARTLVRLSGFAPASLHAMSVRAASRYGQRMFNLLITNAPGPQIPMYIAGARMLEMYPVSPLLKNQALSIGLTSYDGKVYYGLNADRETMSDVDLMTTLLYESMEGLLNACA
ncbi:wax ester/triacylglycerol synthase family O-acyltransferase [Antrihabitans sp. YC2-6]|uniref:WS/DGAT/MGAT family O-acyltransferase n=1 Tax=Antrihabitans sp. YC2-6 TaxID=2799498 RepID=UPI0018F406E7|nr:wax ester/triacylglycerol synthase family O-acyltransferase [Antrihabitans sp. YC2-6]MBJ8347290.1 wax ester/triacylglycerol synthase family O-acyltransferase [Antrihabitans sp. YC2-6]